MMEGHVVRSVLLPFLSALAYVHEQVSSANEVPVLA